MNEAGFWRKVREAINAHPRSWAPKLTDAFTAGTPDALYCINGVPGVLELKYEPAWPKRAETLIDVNVTAEQRAWLERWQHTRGHAHVLLGVDQDWFLLEPQEVPPALDEKKLPRISRAQLDAIRRQGRYGTLKGLKELAPMLAVQCAPVVN